MKKTNLVNDLGEAIYRRYSRASLLNILSYSRSKEVDIEKALNEMDFSKVDSALKLRIVSYYAAKHDGFRSIAEVLDGKEISDLQKMVTEERRRFSVKPASWFKTRDAYKLCMKIKAEYGCHKILDPFHGWGARLAASKIAGIGYVGLDLNVLLNHELKSLIECEIYNEDAFEFDYSKVEFDSVFTCPPYWICEDYGYRIAYPRSYNVFVNNLCDLFDKLSSRAKVQFVSLENFTVGGKKYMIEDDFVEGMLDREFKVTEFSYEQMYRSFQRDYKDLKCFILEKKM